MTYRNPYQRARVRQPALPTDRRGPDIVIRDQPPPKATRRQHGPRHMPDAHRILPAAPEEPWAETAIDITRLDRRDPAQRRQINNAWRALKAAAPAEAEHLRQLFPQLRKHFPQAGIEVPAATLEDPEPTEE